MKCPVCNAELPATAKFCGGCGTTLAPAAPPPAPPPTPSYEQSSPLKNPTPSYGAGGYSSGGFGGSPMPVVKKYKVLRLIAVLMKILSVVIGALLIILGLIMIVAGATTSTQSTQSFPDPGISALLGGFVGGLIAIVYGVFAFAFLYAYAEWMYVFMDIEENTRMTNEMLMRKK